MNRIKIPSCMDNIQSQKHNTIKICKMTFEIANKAIKNPALPK